MSVFSKDIIKKVLRNVDINQILELMNYRTDTIQDTAKNVKCFCPLHKEKVFRTLVIEKGNKNYQCSYSLCIGNKGGDLIDLYAKFLNLGYDECLQKLVKDMKLDVELPLSPEMIEKIVEVGENYLELGAIEDAEKEFKKAVGFASQSISAHRGLFEVYLLHNDDKNILKELEILIGLEFDDDQYEETIKHGEIYLSKKSDSNEIREKIAQSYIKLGDINSAVGDLMAIAENYEIIGEFDKSLNVYKQIEALDQDLIDVYPYINQLLISSGKTGEVIEENLKRADEAFKKKDYNKAVDYYARILELDEKRDDIREKYINCVIKTGLDAKRVAECIKIIQQLVDNESLTQAVILTENILQTDPENIPLMNILLDTYQLMGDDQKVEALRLRLVEIYFENQEVDEAINILQKIIDENPKSIEALTKTAQIYILNNQIEKAVEIYDTLIQIYLDQKDFSKAVKTTNELIKIAPEDISHKEKLADIHLKNGQPAKAVAVISELIEKLISKENYQEAIQKCTQALEIDPQNETLYEKLAETYSKIEDTDNAKLTYLKLAKLYKEQNNIQKAIMQIQKLYDLNPADLDVKMELADLTLRIGDPTKALKLLKPAAFELTKKERYPEAIAALQKILEVSPDDIQTLVQLSGVYKTINDIEEVKNSYFALVDIFCEKKSYNKAINYINLITEIEPDNIKALKTLPDIYEILNKKDLVVKSYLDLAEVYNNQAEFEKEEEIFNKILEIQPDNIETQEKQIKLLYNTGKVEIADGRLNIAINKIKETKDYAQGIQFLLKFLKISPKEKKIHLLLIDLYKEIDDKINIVKEYNSLIEIAEQAMDVNSKLQYCKDLLKYHPDDIKIQESLIDSYILLDKYNDAASQYTVLADIYKRNGNNEEAAKKLQEAIDLAPENPMPRKALAEHYKQIGDMEKYQDEIYSLCDIYTNEDQLDNALEILNNVIKTSPNDPEARKRIIDIYKAQNNTEMLIKEYHKDIDRYKKEEDFDSAIAVYQKLFETTPDSIPLRKELLELYKKQEKPDSIEKELFNITTLLIKEEIYEDALGYITDLIERSPNNLKAKKMKAQIFAKMGNDKLALQEFMDLSSSIEFGEVPVVQQKSEQPESSYMTSKFCIVKDYTFDNFVVGSRNNFAYATALAVAKSPAKSYNPLFLYSDVGLGKTHLVNAIANYILDNNPSAKILYTNTEEFTGDLIDSIQNNTVNSFRARHKNTDVLLIDDVQFLAGKEGAQEEFFHIFNTLFQAKKQIVITSDRPPKNITHLEKRLRSRFGAGIVVDIQTPDLETRIAILKKELAHTPEIKVENSILSLIAEKIESNVRDLKGALNQIIAKQRVMSKEIDEDAARETIDSLLESV